MELRHISAKEEYICHGPLIISGIRICGQSDLILSNRVVHQKTSLEVSENRTVKSKIKRWGAQAYSTGPRPEN